MKLRGLPIAAVVLLSLAGFLYWSGRRKSAEEAANTPTNASPAILKVDESSVTQITLKRKDAQPVVLNRTSAGQWQISEPTPLGADQSAVSSMLSDLSPLNSERVVEDSAADLKQYGLDPPAVEVDLMEKNHKTQRLLLGDDTPAGGAVYTMLAGDPRVFTTASFNKSNLDKGLTDLRDKRLLTLDADRILRVELIRKGQDVEFKRGEDGWQIAKPQGMRGDSFEIADLARSLTDAKIDFSACGAKDCAAAFARATPVATVKVTGGSGVQVVQVRKGKDQDYATSSALDGAYKVDLSLGQALDKNVDDFRNKKLFDFSFNEPDKIELHSGSTAYFLTRSGETWWSNGKKMDAESVEALVSKLRDLTASKFVDTGFTKAEVEATVASDGGKRVERVLISKSGSGDIAERENEPSLYQLDAGTVEDLLKAAGAIKPASPSRK